MSQEDQIKKLLLDGNKHCSAEILEKCSPIVDYRARISSIKKSVAKYDIEVGSEPCKGKCGRIHKSGVHRYWFYKKIQQTLI